ncbi:unnamed protein product [Agarophyton chilense]
MDKLISVPEYETGPCLDLLLDEVEISWNSNQHSNRGIPHFRRFVVMPQTIGELGTPANLWERMALMESIQIETDKLRGENVLLQAADFTGMSAIISQSKREKKSGSTGTAQVGQKNDWDEADISDQQQAAHVPLLPIPTPIASTFLVSQPSKNTIGKTLQTHDGVLIFHNINGTHQYIDQDVLHFTLEDIFIDPTENDNDSTNTIRPGSVLMTTQEFTKNTRSLPESDQENLSAAKLEELNFLLKNTVSLVLRQEVWNKCDVSDGFYP